MYLCKYVHTHLVSDCNSRTDMRVLLGCVDVTTKSFRLLEIGLSSNSTTAVIALATCIVAVTFNFDDFLYLSQFRFYG